MASAVAAFTPRPLSPGARLPPPLPRRRPFSEAAWKDGGVGGRRRRRHPRVAPALPCGMVRPAAIHQDEDGQCVFGKKAYWDRMYGGDDNYDDDSMDLPAEQYSWYCGWDELRPFWTMLVPNQSSRVVIAGIGNDPAPVGMYDAGWTDMVAYDYSSDGVERAKELFGNDRTNVELMTADATNLPMETASVDATLDKGTLDAIYITGQDIFREAVREMGRVTAAGGCVVSISRVIPEDDLLAGFGNKLWENVHDGSLAFAPDGEATIDLGAELYS